MDMMCFHITAFVHGLEKCCCFPPKVGWPRGFCCKQRRGLSWGKGGLEGGRWRETGRKRPVLFRAHSVNVTNRIFKIAEYEWSKMRAQFSNDAWYFHIQWRAATAVQMQRGCQGNRRVLLQMCSEAHTPDIHIASLPLHLNTSQPYLTVMNSTLITPL